MTSSPPQIPSSRLYKLTILAYRNPSMTEAEYQHYWTHTHAPKVKGWLARHGIIRYTQYHTPSSIRDLASKAIPSLGSFTTENLVDYDGFVEIVMPELECYERARKDPYYEEVVKPDEEVFFDMGRSKMIVGWDESYIVEGKAI